MTQYIFDDIRVQVLSRDIIRIERAYKGKFCDDRTYFVPNRECCCESYDCARLDCGKITVGEYELVLPKEAGLEGLRLIKAGETVYAYAKSVNTGELPPLGATPEVFAVSDNPRITVPDGGYTYRGKKKLSGYKVQEDVEDVYLLLCGKDARVLRELYVALTGSNELVRLSTLGAWNSKYYAYTEESARELILEYERRGLPLDNFVVDTDWRSCANGRGYDINEKLFPDMERFISFAHEHGVEVMFNDHPEPVDGLNVFDPKEVKYREENLQALMEKGLDTWWYDRNWTTRLVTPTDKICCETLGMYLYEDITRNFYRRKSGDENVYRRPVIMGNVSDVGNGVYRGITDTAAHRYSIQWTGDIASDSAALEKEINNLIKCTDNAVAYVNSDCGGHVGNPDKDMYVRWIQFGALSPILRPHCTNTVQKFREPWLYDRETLDICRNFFNLRYRLLPVIYKNAHHCYESGEPIFKSLGFEYPRDKTALECRDEYMLGNDILIAPIVGDKPEPVAADNYVGDVQAVFYDGVELAGEPLDTVQWRELDLYAVGVAPTPEVPVDNISARMTATVKFDKAVRLYVSNTDGATVYVDGELRLRDKSYHDIITTPLCDLEPDKEHKVVVEYFKGLGGSYCKLLVSDIKPESEREVYLPVGKWIDVFHGKVYEGGCKILASYTLGSMPLFVRTGALLPLAYDAKNTREQKWDRLVYDFYPCTDSDDYGYLYEDDTETTAYKCGKYRTSDYCAAYEAEINAFAIKLAAVRGEFDGDKCFDFREITVKYHMLDGASKVRRVTVNGADAVFGTLPADKRAFPLGAGAAPDGDCITVTFYRDVYKDDEIIFYLA